MAADFFPFILRCNRAEGYSASEFRRLFMAAKPKDLTWYGYDVTVLSAGEVEFRVFDMADAVYGGVGDEVARFRAEAPASVLKRCLVDRAIELGERQRRHELERHESEIIAAYANELLDAATQPTERK